MSVKEYIEQYGQILGEIKDIENKLADLCAESATEQFDAVQGSSKEIPYQKHSVSLHGFMQSRQTQVQTEELQPVYDKKLRQLYQAQADVEMALDGVNDVQLRRIIRMKCLDEMEWRDISIKIGGDATEESVKKKYQRFLKKL